MADNKTPKSVYSRPIYVVDGSRTPYLKAKGKTGPFSAADLAVLAGRELLARMPFEPQDMGGVVFGCVGPASDEANIARIIALRLGCGKGMPAYTVARNCGSGMEAIDCAAKDISEGRAEIVLAGGTEAMSRAPLLFNDSMTNWLADLNASKNMGQKLQTFLKFRPKMLSPVISLVNGLTDPVVGLIMGKTAENLAYQFHLTREQLDEYAASSQQRAAQATEKQEMAGMKPIIDSRGKVYPSDDGIRHDTTVEKLAKLKPIFDRKFGMVTAGNSAQVTDGAAMVILASEDAVKKYSLPVLGRIVDTHWAALEPEIMGLGPVYAASPLIKKYNLSLSDIDFWEINEAFAAQVLACIAAWQQEDFCRQKLGMDKALGAIDHNRLNVNGGGIALGHPVGSSGARIVLQLLSILHRNKAKRGVAAICIGGGQGGAMLLETV